MDDTMSMSNESLWSVLSGTSVVYSDTIVGRQLEDARDKFSAGLLYYSNSARGDKPAAVKSALPAAQKELVAKIAKMIDVSEAVAWELFCSYLVGEFRGTPRSLAALLSSERHQQALLVSVWRFYHTERLYLLMNLRQIIAHHADTAHPYQALFASFLELLDGSGTLLTSLLDQLSWSVSAAAPSWPPHEPLGAPPALQAWAASALKEQAELLQCLLAYCHHRQPAGRQHTLRLLNLAMRHGFGRSPAYSALLTEQHQELVRCVGALESVLFLHCLQLDVIAADVSGCPLPAQHPLTTKGHWRELEAVLTTLGARAEHGPLLLAWTLLLHAVGDQQARVRTLTRRIKPLDVLRHTRAMLTEVELLSSRTSMIGKISRSAVYNMMNLLLLNFDARNLGEETDLVTICAEVLSVPDLADHFWSGGSGLRLLLDDVIARFPADAEPVLELCAALAQAGQHSLDQVVALLLRLPSFSELAAAVPGGAVVESADGATWRLRAPRRPERRDPALLLPAGAEGRLLGDHPHLVCWAVPHSGWQQALLFLDDLQEEGRLGEQQVQPETASRAAAVTRLLSAALLTASPELARQLQPHVQLLFPIMERHYRWGTRPQPFVHHAADVVALYARAEPDYVWDNMECNRLLPYGGSGEDPLQTVSGGRLGELIEGHECVQRQYPLTKAFLKLLLNIVQGRQGEAGVRAGLESAVAFVLRDVFPAHARWQYARAGDQTAVGDGCLRLCHALLTPGGGGGGRLQRLVAQALTEGPAAETLLQLVVHGEARIVTLLEEQTHWDTGAGLQFIRLIQVALSVLNRLLVLRGAASVQEQEPSLLERLLTSQPAGRHQLRPLLALAQYLFHRHNPHLPTLAVRLLLRLAKVFPMSLLASFGQDSDVICSAVLARLRSETEDVNLKVAVLDFIATCVTSQPGLLQRLIGIGAVASEDNSKKQADQEEEGGFLEELLAILEDHKKSERWDAPLLLSAAALVHALWHGQCVAALSYLCSCERFWPALAAGLVTAPARLPLPLAAHLLRTLALQLYYSRRPDPRLTQLLNKVTADGGRQLHSWSQLVREVTGALSSDLDVSLMTVTTEDTGPERQQHAANLLLAWRDFCMVLATPGSGVSLSADSQRRLLTDLACSLTLQLTADDRPRLVSTLAELVMMLTQRWTQRCAEAEVQHHLWGLLEACAGRLQELPVRARVAVLTTVLHALQQCPTGSENERTACARCAEPACRLLEQALAETEPADAPPAAVRLAGVAALLLRRLAAAAPARRALSGRLSLAVSAALVVLGRRLQQARQPQLCQHLLQMALAASADDGQAARAATALGLSTSLCLPLADLRRKFKGELSSEWRPVWVLAVHLWTTLLRSQAHFFVKEAVDFAAVNCAALSAAVAQLRTTLQDADLEETEAVVAFLATLVTYSKQWEEQHKHSLDTLLPWLSGCAGVCFWYISRPAIVSLLLERPHTLAGREELKRVRRLSSTDPEPEKAPPQVTRVQNRLVRLSSVCLVALQSLSPPLPLLLTQDGLRLEQWRSLVGPSFASPTLDKPGPLPLTYGTLLAGVNVCVRPLARSERVSPARGGEPALERTALLTLLHQTLSLTLSQAALHQLRTPPQPPGAAADPQPTPEERQPLNRDHLHSELTSFLDSLRRQLRRGTSHSPLPAHRAEAAAPAEQRFLELMEHLANTVLAS